MMTRGVKDQPAPAAADVEETLPGLEHELAAYVLEFLLLRLVERIVVALEIRARVRHVAIEPEPIELVGHVVVVLYRTGVLLARMAHRTAQASPGCRPRPHSAHQCIGSVHRIGDSALHIDLLAYECFAKIGEIRLEENP